MTITTKKNPTTLSAVMKKVRVCFVFTVFLVVGVAQKERCPGLTQCSQTTSIKFKATNNTAVKCEALHEGLNCLERVKSSCPASYRITLERAIMYSRIELSRLQCSAHTISGITTQERSSADSASVNAVFFIVFFLASVLYILQ